MSSLKTWVIIFEYIFVIVHCAPAVTDDVDAKIIDINNLPQNVIQALLDNNISITDLRIQQERMKAQSSNVIHHGAPAPFTQRSNEDPQNESANRREYEEMALSKIKDQLKSIRNDSGLQRAMTHEMTFAPACDIPKSRNETLWFESNALNLFFQPPVKASLTIGSAILRLYKRIPDSQQRSSEVDHNCADVESLLRISVYVYARKSKRAELKKKMCSSITVSKNYQGWIEMDVKLAVKIWERANRNLGLAIEVQDQDDVLLKSADHFIPHSCEASAPNIPWNFYRDELQWASNEMVRLPHQPRIDVLWFNPFPYPHHFQYRHRRHNQHKLLKSFDSSFERTASSSSVETSVELPNQFKPHHHKYHKKSDSNLQNKQQLQQQQQEKLHQHRHHRFSSHSSEINRINDRSIELKSV